MLAPRPHPPAPLLAQVVKRAKLIQEAHEGDAELTFAPRTLPRASAAGSDAAPHATLPASERLYLGAIVREEHVARLTAETLAKTATFKPAIDPRSRALAARPRSASVASRPRLTERRPDAQPAALAEKRIERELAGCTFAPAVNTPRTAALLRGRAAAPIQDRLLAAGAAAAARRSQKRTVIDAEALAEVTFRPTINNNAAALATLHRSRSVSTMSRRRPGGGLQAEGDHGVPPAPVQGDEGSQPQPSSTSQRLYADATAIRARLDQRRAELAAEQAASAPFRPAIDPLSRILAARTAAAAETEDGAAGNAVSASSPPRVFDRLYASAFSFADLRAAAVQVRSVGGSRVAPGPPLLLLLPVFCLATAAGCAGPRA